MSEERKADNQGLTYAAAGVDISAGSEAVELMKGHVRKTFRPEVLTELGGFGGLFALNAQKYRQPILVSGTDGVGTKLKVAMLMNKHDTIGIDAVAMCVNDVLVQGAEPLFFLDYLAVGKLEPTQVADIVKGIAEGCLQAGCALIGGETAEMPGFYPPGEYDVAGFVVGVVDRDKLIDGRTIKAGDQVIGLASTGLHSNGYSLARKALLEVGGFKPEDFHPQLGRAVGEELLEPTRIYVKTILQLLEKYELKGLAHITGGGLTENIPRILPSGVKVVIKRNSWEIKPVFRVIREIGNIAEGEMLRTFNMGIGMVLVVPAEQAAQLLTELASQGEKAWLIGEVQPGNAVVEYED
ncbi:MAG: phosphoribosylformylglycinamidine cyclo-ligase [Carboxydocellales bacterium]